MKTTYKTIHTAALQCNCPECYSNSGLELSFKQEWKDTFWSKKATDVVREELFCKHCDFPIYPVSWTEDIERLYEYHNKLAKKETYKKLKAQTYIIGLGLLVTLCVVIYGVIRYN